MKHTIFFFIAILLIGCRQTPEKVKTTPTKASPEAEMATDYPQDLQKILDAHGGLQAWKAKKTLEFTIPKENGGEVHTTDLRSRTDRIEGPSYSLGYDGQEVWLLNPENAYEGDAVFYHNLMFYFYAMPFVLADDGINYGDTAPLEFGGLSYPGIRISYESGVGTSPKDEYFLHYDPETFRMTWLGYTVTYFSGSVSDELHWIKYDEWMDVDGLMLPAAMTFYKYENGLPTTPGNTVNFEAVQISEAAKPQDFYAMPAEAKVAD